MQQHQYIHTACDTDISIYKIAIVCICNTGVAAIKYFHYISTMCSRQEGSGPAGLPRGAEEVCGMKWIVI